MSHTAEDKKNTGQNELILLFYLANIQHIDPLDLSVVFPP